MYVLYMLRYLIQCRLAIFISFVQFICSAVSKNIATNEDKGADQLRVYLKTMECALTTQLICAFVFTYAKSGFLMTQFI